jgi:hypothetical protein
MPDFAAFNGNFQFGSKFAAKLTPRGLWRVTTECTMLFARSGFWKSNMATRTIEISDDVFEVAKRAAAIDKVDVTTLLESLVRSRAEYLEALSDLSSHMPRFSLDHYEMQRDPGENDEEYEDRKSLFR